MIRCCKCDALLDEKYDLKECPTCLSNNEHRIPVDERFDLLDPEFLREMALIMGVGAKKYGPDSWKKGFTGVNSGLNHAYKHLSELQRDVPNDYGPRHLHLAQVAVNCMFEAYQLRKEADDASTKSRTS